MKALAEADPESAPVPAHPVPATSMESSNVTKSPRHDSDVYVVEGESQESLPPTPGNAAVHSSVGGGSQQDQIMRLLSIVKMKMPLILQQRTTIFHQATPKNLTVLCFIFISTGHWVPCLGTAPVPRPRPHGQRGLSQQRCRLTRLLKLQLLRPRVAMEGLVIFKTPPFAG